MSEAGATTKRDRRGDILDAATRLFSEHGYAGTTTDQIAEAAKITKRTLYRHAGSKEQILLLIHERFLDAVDEVGEDWTSGSADERLGHLVSAYLRVVVDQQNAIRVFYEEMKNLSPKSRVSVVERRDAFERSVRQLIADGVASGEFRSTDVPLTASAILGGLANSYRWYSPMGTAPPAEIATTAQDLFLAGLANSEPVAVADAAAPTGYLVGDEIAATVNEPTAARDLPPSIIEAGRALFVENGYPQTSTREVSDRAGVKKSALFYHIRSKEELLFAIQDEFGRKCLAIIDEHLTSIATPGDALGALGRFIVAHCETIDTDQQAVEIFIDQFRHLQGQHRERIARIRKLYAASLQGIIEYGCDSGSMRTRQPKVTALLILGMLNSMYRWYQRGGRLSATRIGEQFADLILHGLLPRR